MTFLEAAITIRRPRFRIEAGLNAADGTVVAVIGPNGAGKSTLVETLCGLVPLEAGRVTVGGAPWEDPKAGIRLPPQRRSVGVMFQMLALFPNMTAVENVAYGMRSLGATASAARKSAHQGLERLGAAELADTPVGRLSGGQAQKVALARALATEPDLLLLDEPTSKLDVTTQMEVRRAVLAVLKDFAGVTVVVTHQPMEAMALADEVVVLEEGRVTQRGAPSDLQLRPRSSWVAEFGGVNLLAGRSSGDLVQLGSGALVAVVDAPIGDVFATIDPNAIALHRTAPEGTPRNVWKLEVADVDLEESRARVRMTGPLTLVAEITRAAATELQLEAKGSVWASAKATQVHTYPR
jgi:molybdate transport system ATP-binding protein